MSVDCTGACLLASDTVVLDRLLPMHLRVDGEWIVRHVAPTLAKMCGGREMTGRPLTEMIELRSTAGSAQRPEISDFQGERVALSLLTAPDLPLRGVVAALPGDSGAILDVSLGLSFERAVTLFDLTMSDFSPCDQTVELLYLQEANAAIHRLSRQLTERLSAARSVAERQALTDPLTGLANRRAMDARLAHMLQDSEDRLSLLQIDLDFFKQVNDTHGHAAGDRVLAAVAEILRDETRRVDLAARVGGDEFLVLLRDTTSHAALGAIAARLIHRIEQPVNHDGVICRVSASIGAASTEAYETRPCPDRLLADTDTALYRAKKAGRGRFAIHGASPPERPGAGRPGVKGFPPE